MNSEWLNVLWLREAVFWAIFLLIALAWFVWLEHLRRRGIVYDATTVSKILGLPCKYDEPPPKARTGEIVIYYGGWELTQLRISHAGRRHMCQTQDWYDDKGWMAEPGYYRLLLPTPESDRKDWNEQLAHLRTIDEMWKPAPVTVAATALLVHLAALDIDLLLGDWCNCAETFDKDERVALFRCLNRLRIGRNNNDERCGSLWLAAAQKC